MPPRHVLSVEGGGFWSAASHASRLLAQASDAGGGISQAPDWMDDPEAPPSARLLPRIKLIVLIPRRQDISVDYFHRYWLVTHAALALSVADDVNLLRYTQSHQVPSEVAAGFTESREWSSNIFEGVTEGWWESEQAMIDAFSTQAGERANELLVEDELKFCDNRTMAIITREYLIYDREESEGALQA